MSSGGATHVITLPGSWSAEGKPKGSTCCEGE
jgi:hypothetical protein